MTAAEIARLRALGLEACDLLDKYVTGPSADRIRKELRPGS